MHINIYKKRAKFFIIFADKFLEVIGNMTIQNVPLGDMKAPSNRICKQTSKTDTPAQKSPASFSDQYKKAVRSQKTDTIELSKRSVKPTLSQIRDKIVADLSKDKDTGVIDSLRSKLESGQYAIDPQELASRMIFSGSNQD